jgi:UDP-N-acetylmuramoyl-tripeptide--D-alanyl-D-alanine ligase
MMRLSALAQILGGELRNGDAAFERVITDSRAASAGDLFVALRGERFDAHAFVDQARAAGAVAALVSEWVPAARA